jgi:hypothetical protein
LLRDRLSNARLRLGPGITIDAPEVHLPHQPFGPASLTIPMAHLTLHGDPVSIFREWNGFAHLQQPALDVGSTTLDYRDHSVGRVSMKNIERQRRTEEERLHVRELHLGGSRWSDVTLFASMLGQGLKIDLGDAAGSGPRASLRYFPSEGRAAEWMLEVPYQSFGALRQALGSGNADKSDQSRLTGTISVLFPGNRSLPPRGSLQLVFDDWFRPPWPDSNVLTGTSGAIGARLTPDQDDAWNLTRVEVAAALFALEGSGRLRLKRQVELTLHAKGSRSCAQLAANLAASSYRDKIRAYLGVNDQAGDVQVASSASPRANESVELSLEIEMANGPKGHARFSWHLTPGCGLEELRSEASGAR